MSNTQCPYGGEELPCTCAICTHGLQPRFCVQCLTKKCLELRRRMKEYWLKSHELAERLKAYEGE